MEYREQGDDHVPCLECVTKHDISELLTGFARPAGPLQPELERLRDQLADISGGVNRLERYAAETADSVRRVLGVVGSEVVDCPRLFTLAPLQQTGIRRIMLHQRCYDLTLWCEAPGYWHPWPDARYRIDEPKVWFRNMSPYVSLVVKVLKNVSPVVAAAVGVVLDEDHFKKVHHQLELMQALVNEVPEQAFEERLEIDVGESADKLTKAEGKALREFRAWLFEHDPMRGFGGLRRVMEPSGEFLWVCSDHYDNYDPGLPTIPAVRPNMSDGNHGGLHQSGNPAQ